MERVFLSRVATNKSQLSMHQFDIMVYIKCIFVSRKAMMTLLEAEISKEDLLIEAITQSLEDYHMFEAALQYVLNQELRNGFAPDNYDLSLFTAAAASSPEVVSQLLAEIQEMSDEDKLNTIEIVVETNDLPTIESETTEAPVVLESEEESPIQLGDTTKFHLLRLSPVFEMLKNRKFQKISTLIDALRSVQQHEGTGRYENKSISHLNFLKSVAQETTITSLEEVLEVGVQTIQELQALLVGFKEEVEGKIVESITIVNLGQVTLRISNDGLLVSTTTDTPAELSLFGSSGRKIPSIQQSPQKDGATFVRWLVPIEQALTGEKLLVQGDSTLKPDEVIRVAPLGNNKLLEFSAPGVGQFFDLDLEGNEAKITAHSDVPSFRTTILFVAEDNGRKVTKSFELVIEGEDE